MTERTVGILVGVFVFVVVGMFAFAYLQQSRVDKENNGTEPEDTQNATAYDNITRVDAKHFYIDGTHTVAGEIMMPTPCDLLEADAVVAESMPEQVTINFTVINNAEMCAQVVTPQRFLVSFDASEDASVDATFEGRDIELNLVPAAEGETPEEFELYIKG